jgi:F-type H+-transporting ATPase subunit a
VTAATQAAGPTPQEKRALGRGAKVAIAVGAVLLITAIVGAVFGSEGKNDAFKPQDEFKLDAWLSLKIGSLDLSINKAVLYLFLAAALTCWTMVWISKRMQTKPDRVQTAVEAAYDLVFNNIARGNMEPRIARKWFPFVASLFFFIWFSNMVGYLPLPTNTHEKFSLFGLEIPSFALYAATANISVTLVLTLVVWFSYNIEGIREKGFVPYFKSWVPKGVEGAAVGPIFAIEVISHFVRIISLSVRLFANILAGHLLILFMAGGLVVLLGIAALGVVTVLLAIAFFLFEVILIATLQAFIFATLTAIYLGGATAEAH